MLGLTVHGDISQLSLPDLFSADSRKVIRDMALPMLLRDGRWEGEYGFHHFGGGQVSKVKWDLFLLRGEAGEIIGAGCLTKDLTRRLDVENRLRESRARLKAASDLVGLSSYQWDPRSGILQWDERLKALWGVASDVEPDEEMWIQGVHPADRERVRAAADRAIDPHGEGLYDIQYRVVGLHGASERWVHTYGQAQFEDGEAVAFTGAVLDITDQKHADMRLRRSEERFRTFAQNTGDILWILDIRDQRLEYLNPAFEPTCGVSAEAAIASFRVWTDCVHPEDRAARMQILERVAAEGETITHEYRILRPDGAVRWVRDTVFPIRNLEDRVVQIGGIAHDISHRDSLCVYVVEPDAGIRDARSAALRRAGHQVTAFATQRAFADVAAALASGCVLVRTDDARSDRFALAPELHARRLDLRLIYESDLNGDVDLAILAMKSGAVDVLQAPADIERVLAAVASALAGVRETEREEHAGQVARGQIALMSQREREVLDGLLQGGTNKIIARELGISPRTVEIHRARVMERLGAQTVPEVVLAATAGGLKPLRGRREVK